jgi:transcriptional regulator with XRE-family HTH domain
MLKKTIRKGESKIEIGQKTLVENWLVDLKKKEVNHYERSQLIKQYLEEEQISQREFAKRLDMPHSTLQDWMLWDALTLKEYNKLLQKGLNDTDIYRLLRDGKKEKKKELLGITKLDSDLKHCINRLKNHILVKESSVNSTLLIFSLREILDKIENSMKESEIKK